MSEQVWVHIKNKMSVNPMFSNHRVNDWSHELVMTSTKPDIISEYDSLFTIPFSNGTYYLLYHFDGICHEPILFTDHDTAMTRFMEKIKRQYESHTIILYHTSCKRWMSTSYEQTKDGLRFPDQGDRWILEKVG